MTAEALKPYVYYKPVATPMHYFYASELAEILYAAGYCSMQNKPHKALVAYMLKDDEPLFYNTRKGLRRVYPNGLSMVNKMIEYLDHKRQKDMADKFSLEASMDKQFKIQYKKDHDKRILSSV